MPTKSDEHVDVTWCLKTSRQCIDYILERAPLITDLPYDWTLEETNRYVDSLPTARKELMNLYPWKLAEITGSLIYTWHAFMKCATKPRA
jgi:hypothetical protein